MDEPSSSFSATATDAAANTSPCLAPISYTRLKAPSPACIVPKLVRKKLKAAKRVIRAAGCKLGKVTKPRQGRGKRYGPLVIRSSTPPAGTALPLDTKVDLTLAPKSRKPRG